MSTLAPRPRFLDRLPKHALVDELARDFERGRYREMRARTAARRDLPPEIEAAVRELLRRTEPSGLSTALLVVTGLLLAGITVLAHAHH